MVWDISDVWKRRVGIIKRALKPYKWAFCERCACKLLADSKSSHLNNNSLGDFLYFKMLQEVSIEDFL